MGFKIATLLISLISLIALAVSGLTAFYTVIIRTDDLSMVAALPPELEVGGDGNLELSRNKASVVLVNSGTRSAAVWSFYISVSQLRPDARLRGSECLDELPRDDRTQLFETDFKPVTVKEKDVVSQVVSMKRVQGLDSLPIPIAEFNKTRDKFSVVLCYDLDASAATNASISTYKIAREWTVSRTAEGLM